MTPDDAPGASRRGVLAAGAALLGSLAGCSGPLGADRTGSREPTGRPSVSAGDATADADRPPTAATTATATARSADPLHVQDTGLLRGVVDRVARAWNANPAPDSAGLWREAAERIGTDARMADHFAAEHGVDPTRTRSEPPFEVVTSLSEPKLVARDLAGERVDAGVTNRGAIDEVRPDDSALVAHTVAHEGQAFVVSPALAEAGVTRLTVAEIRDIYAGEVENWAAVGGPDREPYVVAGPSGTPNPRISRDFFEGRPLDGVDVRFGQHANRAEIVRERDDAVAYLGAGLAVDRLSTPTVVVEGTATDVRDPAYPTTYPVDLYTRGPPDDREAAVIDALTSPVARRFVEYERDLVVPSD